MKKICQKIRKLSSFLFFSMLLTGSAWCQPLPEPCFDNQLDYSFMWWIKTIKKENKVFAIKTSHYTLAFDYQNLAIPCLKIQQSAGTEEQALRESNETSLEGGRPVQLDFGMTSESRTYSVQAYAQNIDDCQLIETGKYFHRRFINNLPDLNGCNRQSSGLEISSWPDRFAFILRATAEVNLENRGLFVQLTFPQEYNTILSDGEIKALKNPGDGSGFILLKSSQTTEMTITGTKVKAILNYVSAIPKGKEINAGLIVYPVAENIEAALERITEQESQPVSITANQIAPVDEKVDVRYDQDLGWHQISLRNDGTFPENPELANKRIERIHLVLNNPSAMDKTVRLNFSKGRLTENSSNVFGITGISAILRDMDGNPSGIPVQLSKNWHTSDSQKDQYFRGPWFHGLSVVTIPAGNTVSMEYTGVNALWGGIPAASHAQLCLVGWGSNQQWDESAIGSWGESITYEPDLDQAAAPVLDCRPLMIKNPSGGKWGWTGNMGGADFFNFAKSPGTRTWHSRMKTQYKRVGPNLTEVTYAGTMDDNSIDFEYTTSIGRSDDLMRGIYRIRMDVRQDVSFYDFVFFQMAASTYHYTKSNTLAWGNENGLMNQWKATIGGPARYITEKKNVAGNVPWFSFTDSDFTSEQNAFKPANRGFVIRSWKARINGKEDTPPFFAEYNATGGHGGSSSLINIVPPENCTSFQTGDYVEAVIEMFQIPMMADDYYGPNQNLVKALKSKANTWEMVYREASGNDLDLVVQMGGVPVSNYPLKIESHSNTVTFSVTGGRGYVPVTIAGAENYRNPALFKMINGTWQKINQEVYGNDFWQSTFNAQTKKWDITFNVNLDTPDDKRQTSEFKFESQGLSTSSTKEINQHEQIKIRPNPNKNGTFYIDLLSEVSKDDVNIMIMDMWGKLIRKLNHSGEKSLCVNANLDAGIYLLLVNNGRISVTGKLVVQ